jgi:hypothetical protein
MLKDEVLKVSNFYGCKGMLVSDLKKRWPEIRKKGGAKFTLVIVLPFIFLPFSMALLLTDILFRAYNSEPITFHGIIRHWIIMLIIILPALGAYIWKMMEKEYRNSLEITKV